MTGKPVKKHRMSIRYENGDENGLISKLNARFCTHFPAVLNCYLKTIKTAPAGQKKREMNYVSGL